jgi:hypothetical protein
MTVRWSSTMRKVGVIKVTWLPKKIYHNSNPMSSMINNKI